MESMDWLYRDFKTAGGLESKETTSREKLEDEEKALPRKHEVPLPSLVQAEVIGREIFGIPDKDLRLFCRHLKEAALAGQVKSFRFRGRYYFDRADFKTDFDTTPLKRVKKKVKNRPNKFFAR